MIRVTDIARIARRVAAVSALALLGACEGPLITEDAYVESAPRPLSGEEMKAELLGNSIVSNDPSGPFNVYFPDEERVLGRHSRRYEDEGVWRVTEDAICVRWNNWWGNVERCFQVVLDGEQATWIDPYGEAVSDVTLEPGNVADLYTPVRMPDQ